MRTHEYFRADAGGGALPSDMLVETWRHTRHRRTSEKSTERERAAQLEKVWVSWLVAVLGFCSTSLQRTENWRIFWKTDKDF